MKTYNQKGNGYYIIARNGRTSKVPFPHPTMDSARSEAERLALAFPNDNFYIFRSCFKINVTEGKTKKTWLRYKKPVKV